MAACEPALGLRPGALREAIVGLRTSMTTDVLEGDPLVQALEALTDEGAFRGTATQLLGELERVMGIGVNGKRAPSDWPASPGRLSTMLGKLQPSLQLLGIAVTWDRAAGGTRIIEICKIGR